VARAKNARSTVNLFLVLRAVLKIPNSITFSRAFFPLTFPTGWTTAKCSWKRRATRDNGSNGGGNILSRSICYVKFTYRNPGRTTATLPTRCFVYLSACFAYVDPSTHSGNYAKKRRAEREWGSCGTVRKENYHDSCGRVWR
jgi:hypothetical protein